MENDREKEWIVKEKHEIETLRREISRTKFKVPSEVRFEMNNPQYSDCEKTYFGKQSQTFQTIEATNTTNLTMVEMIEKPSLPIDTDARADSQRGGISPPLVFVGSGILISTRYTVHGRGAKSPI